MPSKGSERKSIRIPDTQAWDEIGRQLEAVGTDRSTVIRTVLNRLSREAEKGPDALRAALAELGVNLP